MRRLFRRPLKEGRQRAHNGDPVRFARLVDRLGAPFLGVVGPMTIGAWAAAVLGIAHGLGRAELILWLAVGQAAVTASYVYSLAELTD